MRVWFPKVSSRLTIVVLGLAVLGSSAHGQSVAFVRGDVNADGAATVGDPVLALQGIFGGEPLPCLAAADIDGDEIVNIADVISLLSFLFQGGTPPVAPFPDCGFATTTLDCSGPFPACPVTFDPVVLAPLDGSTITGPFIDVRGEVGPLSGTPGLTVTVGSVVADIESAPTGDLFVAPNVAVPAGSSSITIEVTNAAGDSGGATLTLTRVGLPGAQNLAVAGDHFVVARGASGWSVVDGTTRTFVSIPPAPGQSSVDDVAVDGTQVFTLDATFPGSVAIYDLTDPTNPVLTQNPVSVAVGPFAGVGAGGGRLVVSGGTGLLSVREYDATGTFLPGASSVDLGIGQPDVIVAPSGDRAYVSTDFSGFVGGSSFGITVIDLFSPPSAPTTVAQIGLVGAGFSPGAQSPANFPIVSALLGDDVLVAHGGGVTRIDGSTNQIITTTPLSFSEVSVATAGEAAFVVGSGRSLAQLDYSGGATPTVVSSATVTGTTGAFTGVAATPELIAIAANSGGIVILSR